jgi:uncharacterized protein YegL
MKKVNIVCILDMSGSMTNIIEKAREGFNNFLNEQKESKNKIKFSLLFFDTSFYMPYNNVDINDVKPVNDETYFANGGTSLYDAIGLSIDNYIDYLSTKSVKKRPDKSLFVILTDGEENSSTIYDRDLVKKMITDSRENLNCEFIYLGANQDACFVAENIGMSGTNSFTYTATNEGITQAYSKISSATSYYIDSDEKENLIK